MQQLCLLLPPSTVVLFIMLQPVYSSASPMYCSLCEYKIKDKKGETDNSKPSLCVSECMTSFAHSESKQMLKVFFVIAVNLLHSLQLNHMLQERRPFCDFSWSIGDI